MEDYKNSNLPQRWKNFVCGYLENNMNVYPEEICKNSILEHIDYLNKLDVIRETNWKKTFPEIVSLLQEYL